MKSEEVDLAYLVAIISGDGTVTKYYIRISDKKKENIWYIKKLLDSLGVKSYSRQESKKKFIIEINSKGFVDYLKRNYNIKQGKKIGITIPKRVRQNNKMRNAYIQGWFDAEGYPERWRNPKTGKTYIRIRFGCKNRNIVLWLKVELEKLNIKVSKIWYNSKTYRFQIGKKESVGAFLNIVGFRYPTKDCISETA